MSDPLHLRLRAAAAALDGEHIALARLADLHGSAVQGTLLVLMAAPCMLPVPGVGNVLGLGLGLLGWSMWRGQDAARLPDRVGAWEMPQRWARRVLALLAHFYGLAHRLARQRLDHLAEPAPRSWLSAQVAVMAVLIFLPIPFGNVLPALSLMLLGVGFAFRDGWAVLLSAALAACALLYTAALGAAVWAWGLAPLLHGLQG